MDDHVSLRSEDVIILVLLFVSNMSFSGTEVYGRLRLLGNW